MRTIEVSDETYAALEKRRTIYNVETLDQVIVIMLKDTDIVVTTAVLTEQHQKEKRQAVKKSTDIKTGYLWQTFARTLPNFPYDFRELFDVHGAISPYGDTQT